MISKASAGVFGHPKKQENQPFRRFSLSVIHKTNLYTRERVVEGGDEVVGVFEGDVRAEIDGAQQVGGGSSTGNLVSYETGNCLALLNRWLY